MLDNKLKIKVVDEIDGEDSMQYLRRTQMLNNDTYTVSKKKSEFFKTQVYTPFRAMVYVTKLISDEDWTRLAY